MAKMLPKKFKTAPAEPATSRLRKVILCCVPMSISTNRVTVIDGIPQGSTFELCSKVEPCRAYRVPLGGDFLCGTSPASFAAALSLNVTSTILLVSSSKNSASIPTGIDAILLRA